MQDALIVVDDGRDEAELRGRGVGVGDAEVRIVEDVEGFSPELDGDPFGDGGVLQHSDVGVEELGTADDVATGVAEGSSKSTNRPNGGITLDVVFSFDEKPCMRPPSCKHVIG